jgi:SAM-dependent methyltransferase
MAGDGRRRWAELLGTIAGLLPAQGGAVLVDGGDCGTVADRLAATLTAAGRPCRRLTGATPQAPGGAGNGGSATGTITLADGPGWRTRRRWDVVIWLRTPPAGAGSSVPAGAGSSVPAKPGSAAPGEAGADIVIDLHDPAWPVIRHVAATLAGPGPWYITETRAFFSVKAATWDTRFGDDLPAYAAAIAEAGVPSGGVVIDVGCGTGRALPALRQAVGPDGAVIALDLTPEMLTYAQAHGRAAHAALVVGDARCLPVADASVDVVFAAGLIMHLPDPEAGLEQLARITRPGGLLVLFHPTGRAALAARHGRTLRPDEPLAAEPLRRSTRNTGWRLARYDDADCRFLAIATRE